MHRLLPVTSVHDIPEKYRGTPIERLLMYHNLNYPLDPYATPQLFIGMCMDSRKHLNLPENFSYIIRAGGGNLRFSEFKISYAIAIGGARAIAIIGHNQCGMVNLIARKEQFIDGLVTRAGWDRKLAEEHFMNFASMFEIGNEVDFISNEAKRLRLRYPKIVVAPFIYKIEDNQLYLIKE